MAVTHLNKPQQMTLQQQETKVDIWSKRCYPTQPLDFRQDHVVLAYAGVMQTDDLSPRGHCILCLPDSPQEPPAIPQTHATQEEAC